MTDSSNLERFLDVQADDYETALSEIKNGRKRSHWMWYIFPQIHGLGYSETSRFYSIKNKKEADDFLQHPILGNRLISICNELLNLKSDNANDIFGDPDDLKLKSSMTLFASLENTNPVFQSALNKFFKGAKDDKTLKILARS